jgi:hypothetical protein
MDETSRTPDAGKGSPPMDIVEDEEPQSGAVYELRESHSDRVRRIFVFSLLSLIAVIAVGSGVAICADFGNEEHIFDYLNLVFVPVITLSGGPIFYYFAKGTGRD